MWALRRTRDRVGPAPSRGGPSSPAATSRRSSSRDIERGQALYRAVRAALTRGLLVVSRSSVGERNSSGASVRTSGRGDSGFAIDENRSRPVASIDGASVLGRSARQNRLLRNV